MMTISREQVRRLLALAAFAAVLVAVFIILMPVSAADAACKPPGIPTQAGMGVSGMIDPAVESPSGGNYYGQYGWGGLKWHNCDIRDMGALTDDMLAIFDTWVGNALLGLAVLLGSVMTSLHKWTANPAVMLKPIDDKLVQLSDITRKVLFDDWVFPVIILAAIGILTVIFTKKIRSALMTVAVTFLALGFVSIIAVAPLTIAQSTDGVVSSIVSAADAKALEYSGIPGPNDDVEEGGSGLRATPEEATGAVLHDAMLAPLWRQGQTGTGEWLPTTDKMFRASTTTWQENKDGYEAKDKKNAYNKAVEEVKKNKEISSQYEVIKGQQYNRSGMGFMAALMMGIVASIRIPAEALMTLGVLVIRFIPILGPLFAILAIPALTRDAATAAVKVVGAAIFNVAVFGVVASVHTAITAILYVNTTNLFISTLLSFLTTYLLWKLSKPFRSVTKLATGQAIAQELQEVSSGPGNALKSGLGYLTGTSTHQGKQRETLSEPGGRGFRGPNKIVVPEEEHPGNDTRTPQPRFAPALEMSPHGMPALEASPHSQRVQPETDTVRQNERAERSYYEGEIVDVDVDVNVKNDGGEFSSVDNGGDSSTVDEGPEMHREWTRRPRLAPAWQRGPLGLEAPGTTSGEQSNGNVGEKSNGIISRENTTTVITASGDTYNDSMGEIFNPNAPAPTPRHWQPTHQDALAEPEFIGGAMVNNIYVPPTKQENNVYVPPTKQENNVIVSEDVIRPEAI